MKAPKKPTRRKELGEEVTYEALKFLNERGGEATNREVMAKVEKLVELDDWANEELEFGPRWRAILNFDSIYCRRACFLIRDEGVWKLTPEGRNALRLGKVGLLKAAKDAYREWLRDMKKNRH